ncbi:hypothetical protein PVAP13_3KG028327 [Panicum virgatum]|uniref:KIB1-4 beta-propeller domain-containing protein n=1 Tax=Panicum virgatum TaxID=38727 RepID=A0A8T0UKG6_PANVG|nr:hypothetical protein PVAP13_3KG028327 [Panicum virgatum]
MARHSPRPPPPRPHLHPPADPCLFYISPAGAELYSLAAGRSYRLPDLPGPPVADRYIWGSSHDWLVTADARSDLQLLNPATGEQIGLPPVATMEHVTPVLDAAGELSRYELSFYDTTPPRKETQRKETQAPHPYEVGYLTEVLYLKVVLSCDPSRGDCIAMLIHNPMRQLSIAKVGASGGTGSLPRKVIQTTPTASTMAAPSTQ